MGFCVRVAGILPLTCRRQQSDCRRGSASSGKSPQPERSRGTGEGVQSRAQRLQEVGRDALRLRKCVSEKHWRWPSAIDGGVSELLVGTVSRRKMPGPE